MTVRSRTKNSRQRGGHTHGWGSKKKHRGAGNRGGKGRAGTGKKGDAKKPSNIKLNYRPGKHGFKKKGLMIKVKPISLVTLQQKLNTLLSKKKIEIKNDTFMIDLQKIGYNKLLSGKVTKKLEIKTLFASKAAIEKVNAADGKVILPEAKVVEPTAEKTDKETAEQPEAEDNDEKLEKSATESE